MELERAIHEWWSMDRGLTALVPNDRLLTGRGDHLNDAEATAWVSIAVSSDGVPVRTSSRHLISAYSCLFETHAADLTTASRIARRITKRYEGAEFAFEGGLVLDMKPLEQTSRQVESGAWIVSTRYRIRALCDL